MTQAEKIQQVRAAQARIDGERDRLAGLPLDARPFRPPDGIPEWVNGPGVYAFLDSSGALYLGSSLDLRARIEAHLSDPWFRILLRERPSMLCWVLLVRPDGPDNDIARLCRAAERKAIRKLRPLGNLVHMPQAGAGRALAGPGVL